MQQVRNQKAYKEAYNKKACFHYWKTNLATEFIKGFYTL